MLHYNPRHVSSINMLIFRRTNCIITASGIITSVNGCTVCRMRADCRAVFLVSSSSIVTLCKRLYGMSALIRYTLQPFTKSDDTRCCDNTICPPEDGHVNARNMSRIVM